jgi:probable O-glycosylation ligase (exosortase A-associated)
MQRVQRQRGGLASGWTVQPPEQPPAAVEISDDHSPRSPFAGLTWSISFVAFLLYVVNITTYRIGYGEQIMIVALAGLLFEQRLRAPTVVVLLGLLVGWAQLGLLHTRWPDVVAGSTGDLLKVGLIALVAACTLSTLARIRLFMLVFIASYALYPARGAIFNYFLGGYTIQGRALWNYIYANPNDLAGLTLLQLSIAGALYVSEPPGWLRRGALAAMVVLPVLVLLTQSRGGFLGLLLFGIFVFTAQRQKARLLGIGALVCIASLYFVPDSAWSRLDMVRTIGSGGAEVLGELDDQGSAEQRFEIWRTAARIIGDNPVRGVGWGAYAQANGIYSPHLGVRDAHSTYLNVLSESGIVGFSLLFGMIAATLARSRRARLQIRQLKPNAAQQLRMLEIGLFAFLAASFFGSYGKLTFLYLHLILIWMLAEMLTAAPKVSAASARRFRAAQRSA